MRNKKYYNGFKYGNSYLLLPAGTYNNRFEVTFAASVLGVSETTSVNFGITQHTAHQTLTLLNPNHADVKTVALFDIAGKPAFTKENLGTNDSYQFSTSGLSSGIYILDLATWDNQKFSQKIISSNSGN